MAMKPAAVPTRYNLPMRAMHWVMAALIVGMIAAGFLMEDIDSPMQRAKIYGLHKSFGILILGLAVMRVAIRAGSHTPGAAHPGTRFDRPMHLAASLAHFMLYGFMFLMPLSGWAFSNAAGYAVSFFGEWTVPTIIVKNEEARAFFRQCHSVGAFGLCGLVAAHVIAALCHQFVWRDGLIKRMT
ncbi:MAG: cytochrome b [Rickettsiales bacterium]